GAENPPDGPGESHPDSEADRDQEQGSSEQETNEMLRLGAKRRADADLARAARHAIRSDNRQADCGDDHRERAKGDEYSRSEAPRSEQAHENVVKRMHIDAASTIIGSDS